MALNKGKQFEEHFKLDFIKSVDGAFLLRLPDQMSGYKGYSKNLCDFIAYKYPNIFLIECKSHEGNTFPLSKLTQYDLLSTKVGIYGVRVGVIIWFIDKDKVVYVPISEITKMKNDGKKSVNINMMNDDAYKLVEIPSEKKRVFLSCDYSVLLNLGEGE